MGYLEEAVPVNELGQRNLWVLYGRSGSGKTHLSSTFPKPLLYLSIGDDGSNTLSEVQNINAIKVNNIIKLRTVMQEIKRDKIYKTIVFDTFGLVVNEWINENAVKKKKKMTQPMWGDLKTETEDLIRQCQQLAGERIIVLTCHEATDAFEGMEDEIAPDIRPNVNRGARTYLEGMANYGLHCTVITREVETAESTTEEIKHAVHLGSNPYYWVKTQKSANIVLPRLIINPSYNKIMRLMKGAKTNGRNDN